jgi:tetratricopeptide (TPR) repeat protein
MNNQQVENIQKELNLRETEDLVEIWEEHDKSQWTETAFKAIQNILTNRLGEAPLFEDKETAKKLIEQAEEFLESEKLYDALDKSDMAIQLAPHYGYAYYIKGLIFDEMEKPEEAVKLYQEAQGFLQI